MVWRIEFDPRALDELKRLDKTAQARIIKTVRERIAPLENPRVLGQALRGEELGRYWKYRIGDYRLICDIQDETVLILVLHVGHRKEIYR
ncbi:MAG: type II toxin-antitoxin system RelE/ParE family toxin [Sulfurimicrobium sp.]|nr:type II toxin-antitoxin system RelE/ParE family toxin [Sulfurimicrobium sp.]MDO9189563.1 type II toxin-antitoxin system RelE/ParE family toxin [Sulfurimicrobium sp.]MDP1703656.1 type II toxin-antitoxin system RelE/ParE family toxin [Sulfurimicrobium sp.]MDP1896627.1 type II toxin-antitoxin system RelE/ParE family toxin [Sulfurimicrobium sp.]MDP2199135.1 type II toxin-antitoxin system RelE/ParE family toxin [Sulfurimicrobium sp.]